MNNSTGAGVFGQSEGRGAYGKSTGPSTGATAIGAEGIDEHSAWGRAGLARARLPSDDGRAQMAIPCHETLELRVLGPVEALRGGHVLHLGGARQRALLALLLLEPGRPSSADRLTEELWRGEPPAGAQTTLRSYVSRLRRVLGGDVIAGGGGGYAVQVAPEQVDAVRFARLLGEGEEALGRRSHRRAAERLSEALSLWRGAPFAGLADEGRLRREAGRLEELRLRCLEQRLEAELALGASAEVVEELEALVAEHPYRERFWRQLMLALYRAGRQADALAAYTRARAILRNELGLEPSEELRQLEQAILRHDVPESRPPEQRHNLPAPLTSFVGRKSELAQVGRLLGEERLVTLTGVGGAGKTRLALEVARSFLPDVADAVCFVDLSALADPALVPRQVASALQVGEQSDVDVAELIVGRLRDADLLLVLDNCEHLRESCAELVGLLLPACPRLHVMATSRVVLGAPGEIDYAVPPLEVPAPDAGDEELRDSEAVRLLLARVRAARPRLGDEPRVLASAARICRDLDGLPLAIELAAARAKTLSLEEIADRLGDRFRFLVSWRRLAAARHRTLGEAMDWSYELLAPDERALLARLSVFAGGFTLDAVAAVCLAGDEERALEQVGRLVDASLVVPEEHDGHMRYRLLETVRQYAVERLEEDARAAAVAPSAHARFFATFAEEFEQRFNAGEHTLFTATDRELDNLRRAIDWAAGRGDAETELRLVGALWTYWWTRGSVREARARIEAALGRRGDVDGRIVARALNGAAAMAYCEREYSLARLRASEALAVARSTGARIEELGAQNLLGVTEMRLRNYGAARRHLDELVALARMPENEPQILLAKMNLAQVALESGATRAARDAFQELLVRHRREGPLHQGVGFAALGLGQALYRLGEHAPARECFALAHEAFAATGFTANVAHALQGLAAVGAQPERAARTLGHAAALLRDIADEGFDEALLAEVEARLRGQLGDEAFAAAYAEGEALKRSPV
ncbi:MAG: BTAD domain-containing putative transcriptional regulator [Gaiellaceae bacterium]